MAVKLKVMTFNLRTATPRDGINEFQYRTERILETISRESPDLIGFQEAKDEMRAFLDEALCKEYLVLGCGRGEDYCGESVAIALKKDVFAVISYETFWLSATPRVPGSRYGEDQSSCPRVTTAALLKHREAKTPFLFINTHLDHKGSTARLLGAMQLLQYISQSGHPFVMTGDFNARPHSPEILAITGCEHLPITDATALLGGTFHGFAEKTAAEMSKIDYIFTDLETVQEEAYVLDDKPVNGVYISDHRPVVAFVTLPSEN